MADEEGKGDGPALVSDMGVLGMEEVYAKLHLLDYRRRFPAVASGEIAPFSRVHFGTHAHNAALQYAHFIALVTFLLGLCKRSFAVDKFEDPTSTINRLVLELRALGMDIDFPPMKLRTASGEVCVRVLSFLCDKALDATGFTLVRPRLDEDAGAEEIVDEAAEEAEEVEEDGVVARHDIDDDDVMGGDAKGSKSESKDGDGHSAGHGILKSTVDAAAWRAEVERVSTKLKAPTGGIAGGAKEWRSHLSQTQTAEGVIRTVLPSVASSLDRVAADMSQLLDAVSSREKLINASFKHLCAEYSALHDKLTEITTSRDGVGTRVGTLTAELAAVTEAVDEVKASMDEKGANMTDTSPLIRLKTALAALRTEIRAMDVSLGVASTQVLHTKVQHKARSAADSVVGAQVEDDD